MGGPARTCLLLTVAAVASPHVQPPAGRPPTGTPTMETSLPLSVAIGIEAEIVNLSSKWRWER